MATTERHRHPKFSGVLLYKRDRSRFFQAEYTKNGNKHRVSLKTADRHEAHEKAEEWFVDLMVAIRTGTKPATGSRTAGRPTFTDAAKETFKAYREEVKNGNRSAGYVYGMEKLTNGRLLPHIKDMPVSEFDSKAWNDLKAVLTKNKTLASSTLHQYKNAIFAMLNTAVRLQWIRRKPEIVDFDMSYKAQTKPRAWFNPKQVKTLRTELRENIGRLKGTRHHQGAMELRDFCELILFTGMRPDEAMKLKFCDVEKRIDDDTKDVMLMIDVHGKRGYGRCVSDPEAFDVFERIAKRVQPKPSKSKSTEHLFKEYHKDMFNTILKRLDLKKDKFGKNRVLYSLRATYIKRKLLEGVDAYSVARNCRTSLFVIDNFYAKELEAEFINMKGNKKVTTSTPLASRNRLDEFIQDE